MLTTTKVTEVQVYRSSATVIRSGEMTLTAGKNLVYIVGMTGTADSGSFRLKFPEKIRVINLQIVDQEDVNKVNDTKKASEQLQRQLDELEFRIVTCNTMLELRRKNSDFTGRSNVTTEEQENLLAALPEQLLQLHREIDQLNEKKAELEKKIEEAEKEEDKPVIMAELQAEEGGTIPFILQYQEQNSGWRPKYEVQYKDDRSPLEVRMKAMILQSSGEDWKQVKVTLYTGNPSVSNELPSMSALELSLYEPQKTRVRAKGMMMGAARAVADDMCVEEECADNAAPEMLFSMMDEAEVSEEETMKSYVLPNARDILNDTEGNVADLQSFTVKANYHVLSIPSIDPHNYLTAEIAAKDWPLPPATAAIYLGDTYAGDVYVDPERDTDLLTLSLGQDERLTVVRTESPKQTQDVFLKNARKETRGIEIRVVNKFSDKVKLLVKDQVPVSTDKSIDIDVTELSEGVLDADSGEVCWELTAEPDQPVSVRLEYKISWPKDKRLEEHRKEMKVKHRFCSECGSIVTGRFCPECGKSIV